MSYYFRQRQLQALAKDAGAAAFDRAAAQRMWDESKVLRGKTTPASNSGSFAPSPGGEVGAGGARVNDEVRRALDEVRHVGYARLSNYRRYTQESFVAEVKDEMKKRVGPAFAKQAEALAVSLYEEFKRVGPHRNYAPPLTARDGHWAPNQGLLSDHGEIFNPRLGERW